MNRLTRRLGVGALALALVGVPTLRSAFSAPDVDLTGEWALAGANGTGKYTGKGTVARSGDDFVINLVLDYANGAHGTARVEAKRQGDKLVGTRVRTTGLAGSLLGATPKKYPATYVLSADGLKLDGTYTVNPFHESLTRKSVPVTAGKATLTIDSDRDGKLSVADRTAAAAGKKALLCLVPGAPASVLAPASVNVTEGKVKIEVSPADAVKVLEGNAAVTELAVGVHDLKVQPAKEGSVEIRLLSGGTVLDKASFSVEKEQTYLIIFGYMGTEVNYLDGDITRAKTNVLPKLQQAGFTVIEDGSGKDQKLIDSKLGDPRTVKKAIVDWCTTTEDWNKYFDRQSIRGYVWSSHGFMEPYPGCPDADLKKFEARQWTCMPNDPATTGDKHFVREWKGKFEKNAYKMDFGLNHACCTDALGGEYLDEAWEYCTPATKDRVMALFGKLPSHTELTYVGHDSLRGFFNGFQQGFRGPSYFGMFDVQWSDLQKAIKP